MNSTEVMKALEKIGRKAHELYDRADDNDYTGFIVIEDMLDALVEKIKEEASHNKKSYGCITRKSDLEVGFEK